MLHSFEQKPEEGPVTTPNLADIRDAQQRIAPYVRRTPVLSCPQLDERAAARVFLKCENFQYVGAFKARGACNAVFSLDDATARRGVVTHSSGNHAAAVARAASIRQIAATIVMPENSAANKIAAVNAYGVDLLLCEPTAEARQSTADAVLARTGGTLIHPYDDPRTIAGQGTVALELLEQTDGLDVLLVPVGGGGMLSGCLVAAKSLRPQMQVIAAEPAWADDAHRSLQSGRIEKPLRYDTVADGLRTPLGRYTFPIIRELVDDIVLVDEADIVRWTRKFLEIAKLVVEPSAALPVAALMANPDRFSGRRVGIVLSGGNLDLDNLPWKIALKAN